MEAGISIAKSVNGDSCSSPPRAVFVQTDVTSYDSVLNLFDKAMEIYGRIDHAVAGAGIVEIGNAFDPALDMETIRQVRPVSLLSILHRETYMELTYNSPHQRKCWMSTLSGVSMLPASQLCTSDKIAPQTPTDPLYLFLPSRASKSRPVSSCTKHPSMVFWVSCVRSVSTSAPRPMTFESTVSVPG